MNKELSQAYLDMAKNLHKIAKLLPQEIKQAEKGLSPEDAMKIKQAMKDTNFEENLKNLHKAESELRETINKNYR